jgi:hypothetical protein
VIERGREERDFEVKRAKEWGLVVHTQHDISSDR